MLSMRAVQLFFFFCFFSFSGFERGIFCIVAFFVTICGILEFIVYVRCFFWMGVVRVCLAGCEERQIRFFGIISLMEGRNVM